MVTNTGSNTTACTTGGDYNTTANNSYTFTFDGGTGNTATSTTSTWIPNNNWTATGTAVINGGWTTPNYFTYDYGQDARIKTLEDRIAQLEAEKAKNAWTTIQIDTTWNNLRMMLDNMRGFVKSNAGSEIIPADSPKELKVGFICMKTSIVWEIKIHTIRSSEEEMWVSDGKAILIPWCFETQEGRMLLLNMINGK